MQHVDNAASSRRTLGGAACLFAGLALACTWPAPAAAALARISSGGTEAFTPVVAAAAAPVATQPATSSPATTQPGKGPDELLRKWRWYRTAWAGASIENQSRSDQQLVDAILKADPVDLAALRGQMIPEYERLAAAAKPDAFQCGRLASRITLAWMRMPAGKDLSAVQVALNRRQSADEVCRWGLKALQQFAGNVPERHLLHYKSFVPGSAASVISLIAGAATVIDEPGDLLDQLVRLRPNIEALAKADPDRRTQLEQQFQKLFAALEPLAKLQADKAAVLKLMAGFRTAYNARDGAAFAALWPEGHQATARLKAKPFAETIDPSVWTIVRWDGVYVVVQGDLAMAFVVSQYRTKDGLDGRVQLQSFPAKRQPNQGWRLN